MAREPNDTWSAASRMVTAMPRWARPRAVAMPTGPAPITTTGRCSVLDPNCDAGYLRGW